MGRWSHWWIAGPDKSVGYHNLKTEEVSFRILNLLIPGVKADVALKDYVQVYHNVLDSFEARGLEYCWVPPRSWEAFAERIEIDEEDE